jgi:hypothetical protein
MSLTAVATHASRLHALLTDNAVEIIAPDSIALQIAKAIDNLGAALDALNTGSFTASITTHVLHVRELHRPGDESAPNMTTTEETQP